MAPYHHDSFGNPHSVQHDYGWDAAAAVARARRAVADLVGAAAGTILFTSGATEANNLAIKGAARAAAARGRHIITLATEHPSVLAPCRRLAVEGFRVSVLPVAPDGLIAPGAVAAAITPETVLVSVMAANNEIGVLQPLAEIGALCRARGILFHSDAAQAAGKIPLAVDALKLDLLSFTAHKLYGPKGVGALFVREDPPVALEPLIDGGGQERGLRSGTLAPALCVGFGAACTIAVADMAADARRLGALRDRLLARLQAALPGLILNGSRTARLPHNLNLSFPGVDGGELIDALTGIAVASGSACSSADPAPSHVLRALGCDDRQAAASLRLSLGRPTTDAEIDEAAEEIIATVRRLQAGPQLPR